MYLPPVWGELPPCIKAETELTIIQVALDNAYRHLICKDIVPNRHLLAAWMSHAGISLQQGGGAERYILISLTVLIA
jgi:hypothetical protein